MKTRAEDEAVIGWEVDPYATRVFCKADGEFIVYSKGASDSTDSTDSTLIRYVVSKPEGHWFPGFKGAK